MFVKNESVLFVCLLVLFPVRGAEKPAPTTSSATSNAEVETETKKNKTCELSDKRSIDGWSYSKTDLCDGWNDCVDGYDERPDICRDAPDITKFQCLNGKFIDVFQVCDGFDDCSDGLDEADATCETETVAFCATPSTSTVRYQCEFKGKPISCGFKVRIWTSLKVFCNLGYVPKNYSQWNGVNKCRSTGKWLHQIPSCTFDCGSNVRGNEHWNFAVYQRGWKAFNKHCLGTLITPRHILTDYRCISIPTTETLLENELKVAPEYLNPKFDSFSFKERPGLISVKSFFHYKSLSLYLWEHSNRYHDQLIPAVDYNSLLKYSNKKYNFAILDVMTPMDLFEIRPVCFDTDEKLELSSALTGKVVMKFGDVSPTYKIVDLRLMGHDSCQQFLNYEMPEGELLTLNPKEFCGFYDDCDAECYGFDGVDNLGYYNILGGSGLTVNVNGKYYIYGVHVGAIRFTDEKGNLIQVHVFNDVSEKLLGRPSYDNNAQKFLIHVIRDFVATYDKQYFSRITHFHDSFCYVPYTYGAIYTLKPCLTKKRNCSELLTNNKLNEFSTIYINCQENYRLNADCNYKICKSGKWTPENVTCIRLCDPLVIPSTVSAECFYEGERVDCSGKVMAETIATSTCNTEGLNKDLASYNNTCLHNGNWRDSPEVVEILCVDLCGILKSQRPLVQDGDEANSTYHPWNVGLYYEQQKEDYVNICGGTLISKHAVLTAAHCLQDKSGVRVDPKELRIGLGKFYRKFNHPLDTGAQYREVAKMYIPNLFDGPSSAYVADIAILELKNAANLNELIVPACIDTTNKFSVRQYTIGSVVGWGMNGTDEHATQTDTLMKAELPYFTKQSCIEKSKKEYNITVRMTSDKFCALHFKDGKPIVRRGDSGSGITFKFKGRHYVYGLVSFQANNLTSVFTNITYQDHLDFINRALNDIIKNKNLNV